MLKNKPKQCTPLDFIWNDWLWVSSVSSWIAEFSLQSVVEGSWVSCFCYWWWWQNPLILAPAESLETWKVVNTVSRRSWTLLCRNANAPNFDMELTCKDFSTYFKNIFCSFKLKKNKIIEACCLSVWLLPYNYCICLGNCFKRVPFFFFLAIWLQYTLSSS